MCFGNTIVCLQCRQSRIYYRERCDRAPRRNGAFYGPMPNHYIDGLRRCITACPSCRSARRQIQRRFAETTHRDHRRAKALHENMQGRRTFPQTNEELTEEQCEQMYLRGERLHPFVYDSRAMNEMTRVFENQALQSQNPLAWTIPTRWNETIQRQRALDLADFGLTADSQQFRLDAIQEAAEEFAPLPLPEPEVSEPDSPDSKTYEIPEPFVSFVTENNHLMDRESAPSLQADFNDYTEYLERFDPFYRIAFERYVDQIRRVEQTSWNFSPVPSPTGRALSFQQYLTRGFPHARELLWSPRGWQLVLNEYQEHLEEAGTAEDGNAFARRRADVEERHRQLLNNREPGESTGFVAEHDEPQEEEPISFEAWTQQNPPSGELLPDLQLAHDILLYEHEYLGLNAFPVRHLLEFRDTIRRLQQHQLSNFAYQPLSIEGHLRMDLREFLRWQFASEAPDDYVATHQQLWAAYCEYLNRYEAYLEHPELIAHWLGVRARWALHDRRGLFGQARDGFDGLADSMNRTLMTLDSMILRITGMLDRHEDFIPEAQRQHINAFSPELRTLAQILRTSIESRIVPDEEHMDMTFAMIRDGQELAVETLDIVIAAEREYVQALDATRGLLERSQEISYQLVEMLHENGSQLREEQRSNLHHALNNLDEQEQSLMLPVERSSPPNLEQTTRMRHAVNSAIILLSRTRLQLDAIESPGREASIPLQPSPNLRPLMNLPSPPWFSEQGPTARALAEQDEHLSPGCWGSDYYSPLLFVQPNQQSPPPFLMSPAIRIRGNSSRQYVSPDSPYPSPAQPSQSPRMVRLHTQESRPARPASSESSQFDDDDRLIGLSNMLAFDDDSDSDSSSTIMGDYRDEEMSDADTGWFGQPDPFEEPLSPRLAYTSMFGGDGRTNVYDDMEEY